MRLTCDGSKRNYLIAVTSTSSVSRIGNMKISYDIQDSAADGSGKTPISLHYSDDSLRFLLCAPEVIALPFKTITSGLS